MHILAPHQQPHSQILHHHLQQDGQVVYIFLLTPLLVQVALKRKDITVSTVLVKDWGSLIFIGIDNYYEIP